MQVNPRPRPWLVIPALVLAVSVGSLRAPSRARADDLCDGAFLAAQRAEKAGKLVESLAQYRTCAAPACGANMADVCNKRGLELAERVPSVVVLAREGAAVLPKVSVSMDGAPIASDGTAVSVNPGAHTFVFVTPDGRSTSVETLVVEGRRSQEVSATFEPRAATTSPPPTPPPVTPPRDVGPEKGGGSPMRTVGVALVGSGLVLAGVGGILGLRARSNYDASNEGPCDATTNRCTADGLAQRDSAVRLGNAGTVVAVIGGVVAIGGLVLWITGPSGDAKGAGVRSVGVGPTGIVLAGSF